MTHQLPKQAVAAFTHTLSTIIVPDIRAVLTFTPADEIDALLLALAPDLARIFTAIAHIELTAAALHGVALDDPDTINALAD